MKKSAWLLVYFTFFWAFFLDFIESKPFSYRHFRLFQQALIIKGLSVSQGRENRYIIGAYDIFTIVQRL
ncbi:hypothetical protein MiAbW_02849 [Microcystis aeruginosa NIES-4325]|uniref:Uncharacterized protein n=1 Tax=Microcystis aeruginosa NIES-4325 TaxID=2569534 RepID=A0A5J4FCQ7_MICAE|nr:hypothetical protein MiAbW_02849 [Microcystis aeruginosa NIES-4325]